MAAVGRKYAFEGTRSGGDDGQLDLIAALRRLGEYDGGDLITVESDDGDAVRIWIDSNAAGD